MCVQCVCGVCDVMCGVCVHGEQCQSGCSLPGPSVPSPPTVADRTGWNLGAPTGISPHGGSRVTGSRGWNVPTSVFSPDRSP